MYVAIQAEGYCSYCIDQLHWTHFCNISIYVSFVTRLPEDSHMSGRNM
jgi:hypothetical protein